MRERKWEGGLSGYFGPEFALAKAPTNDSHLRHVEWGNAIPSVF